MTYGLIFAAGKQRRFGVDTPKALTRFGDRTLLDVNMLNLGEYCDKVYVVCSIENEGYFYTYPRIVIRSGKGSGDAVLSALSKIDLYEGDNCFIMWGDAYCTPDVIKYTYTYRTSATRALLVPCEVVNNPYVRLEPDTQCRTARVYFKKHGDDVKPGFHDLSLFYGDCLYIKECLCKMQQLFYDEKKKSYIHKHGNELEFLDIFNDVSAHCKILKVDSNGSFSFNKLSDIEKDTCII